MSLEDGGVQLIASAWCMRALATFWTAFSRFLSCFRTNWRLLASLIKRLAAVVKCLSANASSSMMLGGMSWPVSATFRN